MITAAGSQESASEQERREPNGAAGRPAQRPAGIEQRTAKSPDVVSIQAKQNLPEAITCRRFYNLPDATAGTKIAKRKKGFLLKAKSIF